MMKNRASLGRLLLGTLVYRIPFLTMRRCLARAEAHGLPLDYTQLTAHHLAGGRIDSLLDGLIYAQANGVKLGVAGAQARDLVAAHTTKASLTEHISAFVAAGIRDLDSAPLSLTSGKFLNQEAGNGSRCQP